MIVQARHPRRYSRKGRPKRVDKICYTIEKYCKRVKGDQDVNDNELMDHFGEIGPGLHEVLRGADFEMV